VTYEREPHGKKLAQTLATAPPHRPHPTGLTIEAKDTPKMFLLDLVDKLLNVAETPETDRVPRIRAHAAKHRDSKLTTLSVVTEASARDRVHLCTTAAEEAAAACIESGGDADEARQAAAVAYVGNLPTLTTRSEVLAYISCVATAMAFGFIDGKTATALVYMAQTALSALKEKR